MTGTSDGGSSQHIVTTKTAPTLPSARRTTLIKLIHVAKRELRMDEPTYRTLLRSAGEEESLSAMGIPAMEAVLERMKRDGFKVRPKASGRPLAINPGASKARALWLFLHALGEVRDPSEKAMAAYVARIAKVDDLRWARGARLVNAEYRERMELVIETLKKWAMRVLPRELAKLRQQVIDLFRAQGLSEEQHELVQAAMRALNEGEGFDKHWEAWDALTRVLGHPVHAEIKEHARGI